MALEQIIFIGKWIESDGSCEGIQKKLDKYGLVHQLGLSDEERTIYLAGEQKNLPPYLRSSDAEYDFELSDEGEFLPVTDSDNNSRKIVSEYVVRRKTDSLGDERFGLFFPFGSQSGEDKTKLIVGLRAQYSFNSQGIIHSNNFSSCTIDIWGKFTQVTLDIHDAELIILQRDPEAGENTYRPYME
ncbi:hypothetical protein HZA97_01575 [Candidatus Woesearchaeota archaeon]|nr:hypothetical protein [Candidatus Woesearchaeota archaeon]